MYIYIYYIIYIYIPIIVGYVNIHIWLHLFRVLKSDLRRSPKAFAAWWPSWDRPVPPLKSTTLGDPGVAATEWGDMAQNEEMVVNTKQNGGKHQAKSMMDTEKYEEMISKSSEILVYQHNDSINVSAII